MIDPELVGETLRECLFEADELVDGKAPNDAVLVEGIRMKAGLHRERLESKRELVKGWLILLPAGFHKDGTQEFEGGGGWSFLEACNQRDGVQWTGLHQRMEELFILGLGLGMVSYLMPREMWDILPGGMPYLLIDTGAR